MSERSYFVTFSMVIDAESPEAAAVAAYEHMRGETAALTFEVTGDETVFVDVEKGKAVPWRR